MTKRILAIVLAVVLVVTSLAIPTFAADNGSLPAINSIALNKNENNISASWDKVDGADYYTVQVLKDGSAFGSAARVTSTSYTITPNGAGTYSVQINAYKDSILVASGTGGSAVWSVTTSGSGSINMSVSVGSNIVVKWKDNGSYTGYVVEVLKKDNSKSVAYVPKQESGNELSYTYNGPSSDVTKINIYPGSSTTNYVNQVLGTWTNTGSSTGGQTGTVTGNGINATINGSYVVVSWNAVPNASYYQVIYRNSTSSNYVSSQYIYISVQIHPRSLL